MDRIFTVAIIGCGSRGAEAYGREMFEQKDKWKIVSVCDTNPVKTAKYGAIFAVSEENRFCDEFEFFKEKRADALIIATMDNDHVRQCKRALELGYDVLLEKPITANEEECRSLLEAHRRYGKKVMVCHVLRYAPAFVKLKELLEKKVCGEPVMIDSIEQVCYWHQAHSFVRGNWRNSGTSSSMILQKCCHDMDILLWLTGKRCKTVSSFGSLTWFKPENAPEGATERCLDCPHKDDCLYSAPKFYLGRYDAGERDWPLNVLCQEPTREGLEEALRVGPYGRCVYHCDNNVVDHQVVNMLFEENVTAQLTMTAFSKECHRCIKVHGTLGEMVADMEENSVLVKPFRSEDYVIDITKYATDLSVHGGGDKLLFEDFVSYITGGAPTETRTTLADSLISHRMSFAAEESRLAGGEPIDIR